MTHAARRALVLVAASPRTGGLRSERAQARPRAEPAAIVRDAPVDRHGARAADRRRRHRGPQGREPRSSFKIGGVIARIAVDEGDAVRAGQTLAALDLREIDAGRRQGAERAPSKAERDLARARRLYADSVVTPRAAAGRGDGRDEMAHAELEGAAFNRRYCGDRRAGRPARCSSGAARSRVRTWPPAHRCWCSGSRGARQRRAGRARRP